MGGLFICGIGIVLLRRWAYLLGIIIFTIHLYNHLNQIVYGALKAKLFLLNLTDIYILFYVLFIGLLSEILINRNPN